MRELELIEAQEPKRFTTKAGKSRFLGFSEESAIWKSPFVHLFVRFQRFCLQIESRKYSTGKQLKFKYSFRFSGATWGGEQRGAVTPGRSRRRAQNGLVNIFFMTNDYKNGYDKIW